MNPTRHYFAIVVMALTLFRATSAVADIEATITVVEPSVWRDEPKTRGTVPPELHVVVKGAPPGLDVSSFRLEEPGATPRLMVQATAVASYLDAGEPMALVVLVQGNEKWMGNETVLEEDHPDFQRGAWRNVGPVLDALGKAGPPGSTAALVVYHQEVDTRLPIGDLSELHAGALGDQSTFRDTISKSFVAGLTRASTLLGEQTGARRVLVVIGDGEDYAGEQGDGIRAMIAKLEQIEVEVYALHHYDDPSDDRVGQRNMQKLGELGGFATTGGIRHSFDTNIAAFVQSINARYYVTFPGVNEAAQQYFAFDGLGHEYVLEVGKEEVELDSVMTPAWLPRRDGGGTRWWLWLIAAVLAALVALVAVSVLIGRDSAVVSPIAPSSETAQVGPTRAAMTPRHSVPSTTMMLGVGGANAGFPIVGWIVPLTGPQRYQTYKLLHGATAIGTTPSAHIVVRDEFMSTSHAEVVCTAGSFVLNDSGSMNGTFVNRKRVDAHELVDNDVFTLGQTDFKFKSIN